MKAIPLRRRDGTVRAWAFVDDEDFERFGGLRWSLHSEGYAYRAVPGGGTELLHRAIMGLVRGDGLEVDHRNRDRLDCQRGNLRITTKAGNAQNCAARGGSSRFRGVGWYKPRGCWHAFVQVAGRSRYVGCFRGPDGELQAALAVDRVRAELLPFAERDPELVRVLAERGAQRAG